MIAAAAFLTLALLARTPLPERAAEALRRFHDRADRWLAALEPEENRR